MREITSDGLYFLCRASTGPCAGNEKDDSRLSEINESHRKSLKGK